jgi:hypothetical protein
VTPRSRKTSQHLEPHKDATEETREWASLYALGALSADQKTAFEAHLKGGCGVCESDVRVFENLTGQLGYLDSPAKAPVNLRTRLLANGAPHFPIRRDSLATGPHPWHLHETVVRG